VGGVTSSGFVEHVEGEVRALVQQRRVAFDDDAALHGVVDAVLAQHADAYLAGRGRPLDAADAASLRHRIAGFGALAPLLDDDSIEEIWINRPDRVFVARSGAAELTNVVMTADEVAHLVERMLSRAGRRLDRAQPFVDARLPDGSRLHVAAPPITDHWSVNIRKFTGLRVHRLDELVSLGSLSTGAARFLEASVVAGANIVVAGAVGAGKTTLLGCLATCIPSRDRIVTCEEVFELEVARPDVVAMQCRQVNLEGEGAVVLRDLVRESLRMRPDRIIVGEVRGPESLDMLLALNSGAVGMTSVHANSAREAIRKLTTLPLLAGENLDRRFVAGTVAACIDLVVFCERGQHGRAVTEIVSVDAQLADGAPTLGPVFEVRGRDLVWTGQRPPTDRYERAGIDLGAVLA
jgi:pilus assembly protein CpaF